MSATLVLGLAAALSPLAAGVIAGRRGRRRTDVTISALGAAIGLAVLALVVTGGSIRSAGDMLVIDRVGAAWSTFALLTALAVRSFAARQLAADPDRGRFAVASGAAATAGIGLFWAGNLVSLAVAALLTSLAATWLVTYRRDRAWMRRSMARTLLGADLVLVVGVAVLVIAAGDTSFAAAAEVEGPALHLAAIALVVAALARCAQPPFHGWLARSLAAPTPSSALLHAGLVNAGGVLLIRNAPVLAASLVATVLGVAVATAGIVLGLAIMRRRREVKTTLVWSTVAQMGFMLVQALVGLGAAAAAHLIAHGAYKSSLFLSSGSTLEHRPARLATPSSATVALAGGAAVTLVAVATWLSGYDVGGHGGASLLLPAFAVATLFGALAAPAGLALGPGARRLGLLVLTGGAAGAYLGLIAWFETWLSVPAPAPSAALAMTVSVIAVVALAALPSRSTSDASLRWVARIDALARRPALGAARIGT